MRKMAEPARIISTLGHNVIVSWELIQTFSTTRRRQNEYLDIMTLYEQPKPLPLLLTERNIEINVLGPIEMCIDKLLFSHAGLATPEINDEGLWNNPVSL